MISAAEPLVERFLNRPVIVEVSGVGSLPGVLLWADTKPSGGVGILVLGVGGLRVLVKNWICIKTARSHT